MKSIKTIELSEKHLKKIKRHSNEIKLYLEKSKNHYILSNYSYQNLKNKKFPHRVIKETPIDKLPLKVIHSKKALFFNPPHPDALEEAIIYAMTRISGRPKALQYEGRYYDDSSMLPLGSFYLDRPGGRRSYRWSLIDHQSAKKDIFNEFPKLRSLIEDPQTKVITSFGSGGIRLFAHPTLMKFFDFFDLRDQIDEIWGCSGGALAGLPFALGVDPELIEQEGYHLYNDRYSIRWSPNQMDVLQNIIKSTFLPLTDSMFSGFRDCQRELLTVFGKHMKKKSREKNRHIPFYCVAYNLKAQQLEVLTDEKLPRFNYSTPLVKTKSIDAVLASSAIPILYYPKKILSRGKEIQYVDGGTIEEVPLISPYRKWVRDKQKGIEDRKKLVIFCSNLFPRISKNLIFRKWLLQKLPTMRYFYLFARYVDMIRNARIQEHKKTLRHDPNVNLIELNLELEDMSVFDPKRIPTVIQKARTSYYKQLLRAEKSL